MSFIIVIVTSCLLYIENVLFSISDGTFKETKTNTDKMVDDPVMTNVPVSLGVVHTHLLFH